MYIYKEARSKRGGLGGGSSCFFENFLDFSDIITIFWGDLNLCSGQLLNPGAHIYIYIYIWTMLLVNPSCLTSESCIFTKNIYTAVLMIGWTWFDMRSIDLCLGYIPNFFGSDLSSSSSSERPTKSSIFMKMRSFSKYRGSKPMVDLKSNFQNCINDIYRPLQGSICALLIQNSFQHVFWCFGEHNDIKFVL